MYREDNLLEDSYFKSLLKDVDRRTICILKFNEDFPFNDFVVGIFNSLKMPIFFKGILFINKIKKNCMTNLV